MSSLAPLSKGADAIRVSRPASALFFFRSFSILTSMTEGSATEKRVVVFGIFDGVHDGHRDLFRQARKFGDEVIVIVGRDRVAEKLKGKKPKYSEDKRLEMLKQEKLVDDAMLGDSEFSSYTVLMRYKPDIVCLGYDQQALEEDLRIWLKKTGNDILLYCLKPHKATELHSSLLG